MTQVTPKKALIRGVVRTGSPLPRSMEVVLETHHYIYPASRGFSRRVNYIPSLMAFAPTSLP